MLTKKVWNSLSRQTRETIIMFVEGEDATRRDIYRSLINENYNHDFDYDQKGKRLKAVLAQCTLKTDGTIMIVNIVKPTYAPKVTVTKAPVKKATPVREEPCTWYIDYEYPDGDEMDLAHCWVTASSRAEAESEFWHDHSSRCEIIQIYKER